MAWTQPDLDKLQSAIASGIQQVTYADGRTVRYQNMDQMLVAVTAMKDEIAGAANAGRVRRTRTVLRVGRCR